MTVNTVSKGTQIMNTSQADTLILTEEAIKGASESDYMNDEQLAFFKDKLIKLYEITTARIQDAKTQMIPTDNHSDSNDRASWQEQSTPIESPSENNCYYRRLKKALERIRLGTYGYCIETDEPIGIPRLLIQPTSEYCADSKVFQEQKLSAYRSRFYTD